MKYNIYINQFALSATRLDAIDAIILDYLFIICASSSPQIEANRVDGYTWVDYQTLLDQNPILRIKSKGALPPRIAKLEEDGFIKTKKLTKNTSAGARTLMYVKTTEKMDTLFIQMNQAVHEDEPGRSPSCTNNTTIYNTTKDNRREVKLGTTKDVLNTYRKLYGLYYGFDPTIPPGKGQKLLEPMVKNFGAVKVGAMLAVYFEWAGSTGDDYFTQKRLQDECHPIERFPYHSNAIAAYVQNSLGVSNDEEAAAVLEGVIKRLKN